MKLGKKINTKKIFYILSLSKLFQKWSIILSFLVISSIRKTKFIIINFDKKVKKKFNKDEKFKIKKLAKLVS